MRTWNKVVLIATLALAIPLCASAQQLFDFNGQATVPAMVGGDLEMYGVIYDPAPSSTPIPLDFANFEYTIVITSLGLDVDGMTQSYSGGLIAVYEDAATAADFAATGTFTDGTAILTGEVTTLSRTMFTATLGSSAGNVNWTGGTRIGELMPDDWDNWPLLSGINASASNVEPGFDENWDGKTETIGNDDISWGELKARF